MTAMLILGYLAGELFCEDGTRHDSRLQGNKLQISKQNSNFIAVGTTCSNKALDVSEVSVFLFGEAHNHYSGGAMGGQVCINNEYNGKGFL